MTISKSTAWKIAAGFIGLFLLWQGYSFTKGMWIDWALNQAKAKHQAEIAELQARIDAGKTAYNTLSENAAREREESRIRTEKEKLKAENDFAIYKSETAAELRSRNATIGQVLAEKEKDEKLLVERQESMDAKDAENEHLRTAWKLSDEEKDREHARIVANLELKYQTCAKWTTVLEKRLKKSFWSKLGEYAKYGAAFSVGYAAGRMGK